MFIRRNLPYILPWIFLIVLWEVAGRAGLLSRFVLPWPSLLVRAFAGERSLGLDTLWSLLRVMTGFCLAVVMGTAAGFTLALNQRVAKFFEPALQILRPIPPIAWIPLAIVWFGLGNGPAFFLTFLAAFFPILLSSVHGVKSIARQHFDVAHCLEASRWMLFKRVIVPGAMAHVMSGYRIGFGIAWMAVVAAEMISAQSGLGHLIHVSQDVLRTDLVIVGMILIGAIDWLGDVALRRLTGKLTPWAS